MKIVQSFLQRTDTLNEFRYAIKKFKSAKFLNEQFERIIMTRLLRKKYIYSAARTEFNFLIEFYRDMNTKRGRQIAFKLEDLD